MSFPIGTNVSQKEQQDKPDLNVEVERRSADRQVCGGPIWWKEQDNGRCGQGWLLERADDSAAFLIRGHTALLEGTKIQLSTTDPAEHTARFEDALVSRIKHVHADVVLVVTLRKPA